MTTESADGVKLGMMLEDKFRIPNNLEKLFCKDRVPFSHEK